MGLTMPQIGVAVGIAAVWLLVAMMFAMSMQMRLIVFGPMYLFTLSMVFVKPFGLMLPVMVILSLKYIFVKPSYESSPEQLIDGPPEVLMAVGEVPGIKGKLGKMFPFLKQASRDDAFEARALEAKAEVSRQTDEAMRNAHASLLDMVKSLWKG